MVGDVYKKSDLARIILRVRYVESMWCFALVFLFGVGSTLFMLKRCIAHPEDLGGWIGFLVLLACATLAMMLLILAIKKWRQLGLRHTFDISDWILEEMVINEW